MVHPGIRSSLDERKNGFTPAWKLCILSPMAWLKRLKKKAVRYGRFTRAGGTMLSAAAVAVQPLDYVRRRRVVVAYNERFPASAMTDAAGYTLLPPGALPGITEVVDACHRLFQAKNAELGAFTTTGKKAARDKHRKRSFQRDLLTNEDLLANPWLVDFALSDPVLSIVTNYLGIIPHLTRVDLVYSIPRDPADGLIASQLFHQDPEGLRQVKVYVNLFDVDDQHGPFMFIPAADTARVVRAMREERHRKGEEDPARYRDDEIDAQGGMAAVIRVTGPAGTTMAVDTTRCLHAGSRVQPGHIRLMLFLQYCTSLEKAHLFDAKRYRTDPVRWLALKRHAAPR